MTNGTEWQKLPEMGRRVFESPDRRRAEVALAFHGAPGEPEAGAEPLVYRVESRVGRGFVVVGYSRAELEELSDGAR